MLELIQRTKAVVRDLDNFQYRKMRKLMFLDEQQLNNCDKMSLDSDDLENLVSTAPQPGPTRFEWIFICRTMTWAESRRAVAQTRSRLSNRGL